MGVLGYEPTESQLTDCGEGAGSAPAEGVIESVEPESAAAAAGLGPGDRIVRINGSPVRDVIDYVFNSADTRLEVEYHPAAEPAVLRRAVLEREFGEDLGIVLRDFKIRMCNNQCVFCFIHQNPKGLRKSIYFKDGDFRMSFLHGNYITTTNMTEEDFERIIGQRLSPMYVSVHTTDHELRLRMLGVRRSNNILDNLKRLARGRIDFHTQIVLCPGWNDGEELKRTVRELADLAPALLSVAIVPLGLTDHREGLPEMRPVTPEFCRATIRDIEPLQQQLTEEHGERIAYLADEFYVIAGMKPPDYSDCDILPQLENGVGMVWEFMLPWRKLLRRAPERLARPRKVAVLTGLLGASVLERLHKRLSAVGGLEMDVLPCVNSLFGESITVSGLLAGRDFERVIRENPGYDSYLLPGNSLRADGDVFLDDMTLDRLERCTKAEVKVVHGNCLDLAEAVLGVALRTSGRAAA